jgi:DNA-binding CsgD family transcriptional regulator
MTKRDVLTKAVALDVFTDEEKEVLQKMIDGLNRKSSKPTKAQIENLGIKNDILALIADGYPRTAKEIADEVGYTTAKVSALLRAIVLDGKGTKVPGAKTKDAPKYVGNEDATPYEV